MASSEDFLQSAKCVEWLDVEYMVWLNCVTLVDGIKFLEKKFF